MVLLSVRRQYHIKTYARSGHRASEGRHARHHRYTYQPEASVLIFPRQPTLDRFSDQYSADSTSSFPPIAALYWFHGGLSFLLPDLQHLPTPQYWRAEIHLFQTA